MPEIDRVEVDPVTAGAFEDEDDFTEIAVSLLVEAASYVVVAASIKREDEGLSREQALGAGLLVRLYKLLSGVLDQVCQRRLEIAFILCRLAYETVVDVRYLTRHLDEDLADDFVATSFRHERLMRDLIKEKVVARGGEAAEVEKRMLLSIEHAASAARVNLDDVNVKRRNWGGKSTRDKAVAVFGDDLSYIAAFGGMSKAVHGDWGDLVQFHLTSDDGDRFEVKLGWGHPRPQILTALAVLTTNAVEDYLRFWSDDLGDHYAPALDDLRSRVRVLAAAHESYLGRFEWPRIRPSPVE